MLQEHTRPLVARHGRLTPVAVLTLPKKKCRSFWIANDESESEALDSLLSLYPSLPTFCYMAFFETRGKPIDDVDCDDITMHYYSIIQPSIELPNTTTTSAWSSLSSILSPCQPLGLRALSMLAIVYRPKDRTTRAEITGRARGATTSDHNAHFPRLVLLCADDGRARSRKGSRFVAYQVLSPR